MSQMPTVKSQHSRLAFAFVILFLFLGIGTSYAQISAQDIVPSQPGPNVRILGPSTGSNLGGTGSIDNFGDANRAQSLITGDFNGDGTDDLAIGAPDARLVVGATLRSAAGAVYIIFGRSDLPNTIDTRTGTAGGVDVTVLGVADGDRLGFSLAAGDVNGDGVKDLIIGAPNGGAPAKPGAGAVYVILGSQSLGSNATVDLSQGSGADLTIYGAGDRFGAAVSTGEVGGAVSGGPIMDILVGAPGASIESGGACYLFWGGPGLGAFTKQLDAASGGADFTMRGRERQHLGISTAIGDFNGDGHGDLFAGAPGASRPDRFDLGGVSIPPGGTTGAAFGVFGPVIAGTTLSLETGQASVSLYGFNFGDRFGASIVMADFNGDGVTDLAVGAPSASGDFAVRATSITYTMDANAGAAYVFAGSRGFNSPRLDIAAEEYSTVNVFLAESSLGFSLAAGSYNVPGNADTIADLIIGLPAGGRSVRFSQAGLGGAKVLFGGPALLSTKSRPRSPLNPAPDVEDVGVADLTLRNGSNFGFSVAAGDINADSSGDLIVSAPFADADSRTQAGIVEIRFGTVKPAGGGPGPGPTPITVRLNSPLGGERFMAGSQVVVAWAATGKDRVRSFDLQLSTDGGGSFSTNIATGIGVDQNSIVWNVPNVCSPNSRLQLIANTVSGDRVITVSDTSFSIEQRGPGVDLTKSSIGTDSLLLVAASGERFPDGAVLEISRDEAGAAYSTFSRSPKLKGGGKKLKTRGSIDGKNLDQYFPDGAARSLRVSASPCAVTLLKVRRNGEQLQVLGSGQ